MTAPLPDPDPAHGERRRADSVAALCLLLADPHGARHTDDGVTGAIERTMALLATNDGELDAAFEALDDALRRSGDPRGLLGYVRGILGERPPASRLPGLRSTIKVALCPATEPCVRREPTRDLRAAPLCAVNGTPMRKVRLGQDPTE